MLRSVAIALLALFTAQAGTVTLNAGLSSAGGPESAGAYGMAGLARVTLNPDSNQVCYSITAPKVSQITAIHIHRGTAGETGPIVVSLPYSPHGQMSGCTAASAQAIQAIIKDPAGYYVNVHTARHPQGAVRGQLEVPG